jgi:hypothetical protein
VIMIEFFIDDSAVREELGISRDPSTTPA